MSGAAGGESATPDSDPSVADSPAGAGGPDPTRIPDAESGVGDLRATGTTVTCACIAPPERFTRTVLAADHILDITIPTTT